MIEPTNENEQAEVLPKKIDYVLLSDVDFFGRRIQAGTIFKQINGDYWQPTIKSARCPSLQIDFMIVRNNPQYFLEIQR